MAELAAARRDITRLRTALAAKDRVARIDALTGLPNRKRFLEELDLRRWSGQPWSLTLIDLDRFKAVNDTFGHAAGDAVLIEVASRLSISVGDDGFAARLHGDEFAVVHPAPAADAAYLIMHAMALVACPIQLPSGVRVTVHMSAGLVDDDPLLALTDLLRRADETLYAAKPLPGPLVWKNTIAVPHLITTDRRTIREGAIDVPRGITLGELAQVAA